MNSLRFSPMHIFWCALRSKESRPKQSALCFTFYSIIFSLFFSSVAMAKDLFGTGLSTRFNESTTSSSTQTPNQEKLAALYGLNMTQWKTYQNELNGPRGLWSPNIHPLMVLGMRQGITKIERRQLARKMAKVRYERVKRELAFENAVLEEAMKMYGHLPLFKENKPFSKSATLIPTNHKHIQFFVSPNCKDCKKTIQKWIRMGQTFDLFITGNRNQINQFARAMEISPLQVPRLVTLNPINQKQLNSLGIKTLPAIRYIIKEENP